VYKNINDAKVINKGVEVMLGYDVIKTADVSWNINANATFLTNKFDYPKAGVFPLYSYRRIAWSGYNKRIRQAIAHDQPINVYYLADFQGFDKDGIAIYSKTPDYQEIPTHQHTLV
jgi:iron complex outermembrane receptor protein